MNNQEANAKRPTSNVQRPMQNSIFTLAPVSLSNR